jgi:chemotaxis protein histidine kinase CheA/CheY-like chemotaxis protein
MTIDPTLYEESYASFLLEAQDVLQRIEQDLLSLKDDRTPAKVHSLMRSAHTLKGAAASVELKSVKQVAHVLEDIFKALYNPAIRVEGEVEALLFQGYECLRLLLMAEITGGQIDEQEILNRAAGVIAQIQETLGDEFDRNAALPHSSDFGVDVVQSLFEVGVEQRLTELRNAIDQGNPETVANLLQIQTEVFLGLAEFADLPGFAAIAQTTLEAVEAYPDQALQIAQLSLQDFTAAQAAVLAGDRNQGGSVSAALKALAGIEATIEKSESIEVLSDNAAEYLLENATESITEIATEPGFEPEFQDDSTDETRSEERNDTSLTLDHLFGWIDSSEANRDRPLDADEDRLTNRPVDRPKQSDNEWITHFTPASLPPFNAPSVDLPDSPRFEPVRVDIEQLKHLDYLTGELLISQGKQTAQDQQLRVVLQAWRSHLQKHQQTIYELQDCIEQLSHQNTIGQPILSHRPAFSIAGTPTLPPLRFDALELERYHDLHQLMQSSLNEIVQLDDLAEDIEQVNKQGRRTRDTHRRLLTQVRDDLNELRMQPLRDLVNRFPRLLQQLATAHGKQVELVLTGTHVLVDKAIAAKLYDPLLHLIRNAFDHGIEPPEQRRRQGKPEQGRIEIRAIQQGTQTVIEVCDDGRGIDLQRVAQRAIELNVLTAEQASTMPESQLLDILLKPGFSTATQVSDLSGRGIGLDVVNNQLQIMNGSIAISSIPQQGTTFSLKIPFSLTITKLLVCQTAGFTYALPIERVEQIVMPQPDQLQTSIGQQVMHWQQGTEEFVVPIYSLSELVHYSVIGSQICAASHPTDQPPNSYRKRVESDTPSSPVLLLQTIYGRRGLKVDRILGEHELVIRPLGNSIAPPPYVYGCCILGNSQSALVVDIEILMQLTTEVESSPEPALPLTLSRQSPLALLPVLEPSLEGRSPTVKHLPGHRAEPGAILVVDDSLTLRQSVMRLLERAGHRVIPAEDGLEALVQLQQHADIHLIICDLEMPRLNGFEFLSQFRQHAHIANIPVIVLTSRTSAKHRQIASELGALAYLTKPFDSHQLLTTVDRWLHQPRNS